MTRNLKSTSFACGFRNPQGLVPAWKSAQLYAGEQGHIATLPDIISARLASKYDDHSPEWHQSFTTSTAEYVGIGARGRRLLIVAHGVGPMSTLDGVLKAYSHEYKDKERNRRGGRIARAEFLLLESGFYGEVQIVDLEEYCGRREYPFLDVLSAKQALNEPLAAARLGPQWREYIERHNRESISYISKCEECSCVGAAKEQYILQLRDASNCHYNRQDLPKHEAFAHLLQINPAYYMSRYGRGALLQQGLGTDIKAFEWRNSVRFAGVTGRKAPTRIEKGLGDLFELMEVCPELCSKPVRELPEIGFRALLPGKRRWFTEYPKDGSGPDTEEPEFIVTELKQISSGPSTFETGVEASGRSFRYDISAVQAIAPPGANAYYLNGEGKVKGKKHVVPITFYRVCVDNTRRLRRADEIYNDLELLQELTLLSNRLG